jgi:hypothetical protein
MSNAILLTAWKRVTSVCRPEAGAALAAVLLACGLLAQPAALAAPLDEGNGAGIARLPPGSARQPVALPQPRPPVVDLVPPPAGEEAPSLTIVQPRNASTGLSMVGTVTASWGSSGVRIQVAAIQNTRAGGTSGTLRLVLWATPTVPVFGNTIFAYTLGTYTLGTLQAGFEYTNVDSGFVTYTPPPMGCYYITVALEEYNGSTFPYEDLLTFTSGGTPDGSGYDLFSFGGAACGQTVGCSRTATTACLLNGRFQVDVTYNTSTGSGNGQVMYFGSDRAESDQSVFLWFFSATNFEMGLKILNACSLNNHFWVFIGGLTNQGWTVNILDTQTLATATYSNALNNLTSTTADTSALPCP